MLVIPATWETKVGRSHVQSQPREHRKTLSKLHLPDVWVMKRRAKVAVGMVVPTVHQDLVTIGIRRCWVQWAPLEESRFLGPWTRPWVETEAKDCASERCTCKGGSGLFSSSNSTCCMTGEEDIYIRQGELSDSRVPLAFLGTLCYRFPIALALKSSPRRVVLQCKVYLYQRPQH